MSSWTKHYRFFLLLIFLLVAITGCDTEKSIENPDLHYFVKYYGADGNQRGVDMAALSDGSFLLLGNYSTSTFDNKVYLMRVNPEGDVIWEKKLTGQSEGAVETAIDLEPTNDGNFIVLCDFQVAFGDTTDMKLLKISPEGVPLDSTVVFGTPANDHSRSVTLLDDGGFMVSGTTEFTGTYGDWGNSDPDLGDVFNYRFDQNLEIDPQWGPVSNGFGSHLDVAVKAIQIPTGFYVFGYTNSQITGGSGTTFNPDGRLGLFYFGRQASGTLGNINYPGNVVTQNDTEIKLVERVPDQLGGGFFVIGTSQNQIGNSEIVIARMRPSLAFNRQNDLPLYTTVPLGRNIQGISASPSLLNGAGYLLVGNELRSDRVMNIWLSKIDQSGQVLWSSTFGSESEEDQAAAAMELPDGKIVVLGTMGLADKQYKMAFIKLNPRGELLK